MGASAPRDDVARQEGGRTKLTTTGNSLIFSKNYVC